MSSERAKQFHERLLRLERIVEFMSFDTPNREDANHYDSTMYYRPKKDDVRAEMMALSEWLKFIDAGGEPRS